MHHYLLPLIPLTLAGAIFFKQRLAAYGFPVLLVFIKAAITTYSPLSLFTVGALWIAVFGVRKMRLAGYESLLALAGVSAGAVFISQIFSGLGVWTIGGCVPNDPPLYPHTLAGLVECYAKALPYAAQAFLRDVPIAVILIRVCSLLELSLRAKRSNLDRIASSLRSSQ